MYPFKETLNVIVGSDAGGGFRKKKKKPFKINTSKMWMQNSQ